MNDVEHIEFERVFWVHVMTINSHKDPVRDSFNTHSKLFYWAPGRCKERWLIVYDERDVTDPFGTELTDRRCGEAA